MEMQTLQQLKAPRRSHIQGKGSDQEGKELLSMGLRAGWGCVRCVSCALCRAVLLLLHRGQSHKSESIDFQPCQKAKNCHVESPDLGTHTKTTIPLGPLRHGEERSETYQH